jgi:hypothetical protein
MSLTDIIDGLAEQYERVKNPSFDHLFPGMPLSVGWTPRGPDTHLLGVVPREYVTSLVLNTAETETVTLVGA